MRTVDVLPHLRLNSLVCMVFWNNIALLLIRLEEAKFWSYDGEWAKFWNGIKVNEAKANLTLKEHSRFYSNLRLNAESNAFGYSKNHQELKTNNKHSITILAIKYMTLEWNVVIAYYVPVKIISLLHQDLSRLDFAPGRCLIEHILAYQPSLYIIFVNFFLRM